MPARATSVMSAIPSGVLSVLAAAAIVTCSDVARAAPPVGDAAPTTADAAKSDAVAWQPGWARFRTSEFVLVPTLGAAMLTIGLTAPGEREPSWTGRNGFDDAVRDGLRGTTPGMRAFAGTTSDIFYVSLTLYPAVVESLVLAGIVHKSKDVAFQLFMIYGESALSAGVLTVASQGLVGRGRPLVDECARDAGYDSMCGSRQQSRSFFAGHVAMAMNSAALVCVHQAHLPLYGSRAGGIAACATTMTLAATTAVFRVVADKHWATDVLTGTAVGLASGFLYPLVLHYGFGSSKAAETVSVTPVFVNGTTGLVASFTM